MTIAQVFVVERRVTGREGMHRLFLALAVNRAGKLQLHVECRLFRCNRLQNFPLFRQLPRIDPDGYDRACDGIEVAFVSHDNPGAKSILHLDGIADVGDRRPIAVDRRAREFWGSKAVSPFETIFGGTLDLWRAGLCGGPVKFVGPAIEVLAAGRIRLGAFLVLRRPGSSFLLFFLCCPSIQVSFAL